MARAGGIVALIAGVLAVMAAVVTLLVGGCGAAFEAEGAETVVSLGWGGMLAAFACIVLGSISAATRKRWPGILLILCALLGAVFGGTLVAVVMVLALVGGFMVALSRHAVPEDQQ
ncbi:MAG: hypothetical protein ACP5G7_06600 [Anaerolineae bacterium]